MVFQRSVLNWGVHLPSVYVHSLYVKLIWYSGFPEISAQLEDGGYVCLRYMCILLYVKLIWCNVVA